MRRFALAACAAALPALLPAASPAGSFRDVTAESGIDFAHSNGATGTKDYREVMGSGACLLDYDGDGRLDIYLVNSAKPNRMYRNLGGLRFADATDASGTGDTGYGMGAVAADIDNDGDADLFVTNVGPNRLYMNRGDGTFRDASERAGLADPNWGAGAAFFDMDGDGLLDLYVANYVQVASPDTNECVSPEGLRLYCSPKAYPRATDRLYRNLGDGTFRDVTSASGVDAVEGRGLGVLAMDVDGDGRDDLYVANDLDPNFLFHNEGDGHFTEVGMISGVSHSEEGVVESGMGIADGDLDLDGRTDLFVTNYQNETNTLYRNEGGGFFFDESASSGLGPSSLAWISWGTGFIDYDLDGWPDLLLVNGHTESDAELSDPTTTWKQPDALFRNRGDGSFDEVTAEEAPMLLKRRAGRGVAFGDLDDDGDTDVVIVNQNGAAMLLEATGSQGRHWLGVRLRGVASSRDGIGARVETHTGGRVLARQVHAGGSYLSGNDLRVLFGPGEHAVVDSVVVRWPSGAVDRLVTPQEGRYHLVTEGGDR
ncbi:MAG: CRTAC1 family protein [Gemmatimonadota bacterium]|jgi:hypothetical protein|nr:CRTAC1 family protein [Gemmatimonadota bacterium]